MLPALTKVAWQIRQQEIRKEVPGMTRKQFLYNLSRSSYEKDWGAAPERPGIRSRVLAVVFRIMPKSGTAGGSVVQAADTRDGETVHGKLQRHD